LFSSVPVPLHPTTPIQTHHYPSALLFFHFWQNTHNIMVREISPAITLQKYPT
jgi:hypothetical protein